MMQSASWYHPAQITLALGVTLPLFLYYGYRIYNLVLDHRAALRRFLDAGAGARLVQEALREKLPAEHAGDLVVQLALAEVFAEFDHDLGSRRRALRTDSQAVVLVGFIGTLIGVSGAFASLVSYGSSDSGGALGLLEQLVGGGLATALVSSLVAALLGVLALGYLSATERAVVTARRRLLADCRAGLRSAGFPDSAYRSGHDPRDVAGEADRRSAGVSRSPESAGSADAAYSTKSPESTESTGAVDSTRSAHSAGAADVAGPLDSQKEPHHVVTTR